MTLASHILVVIGVVGITACLIAMPRAEPAVVCCPSVAAQAEPVPSITLPLPDVYISRIQALEGWRSCERDGLNGYNTKAEVQGECIPRVVGYERLHGELMRDAATVDSVNRDIPVGTRAALTSLTHSLGPSWATSYLGAYVRAGKMNLAKELFVEYVGGGTAAEQAAQLKRRRIELTWWGREASSSVPFGPPAAPAGPATRKPQPAPAAPGWRFDERGLREMK